MAIYTEAIIGVFLIPIIGLLYSLGIVVLSILFTYYIYKWSESKHYNTIKNEVKDIPWWTGWIIQPTGWNYFDFGILNYEEINIDNSTEFNQYPKKTILQQYLSTYSFNAKIYKIYPDQNEHRIWNTDYIYVILPDTYKKSLGFDQGLTYYKEYHIEVQITPIIMKNIGLINQIIPVYLMIGSTYQFNLIDKIFNPT